LHGVARAAARADPVPHRSESHAAFVKHLHRTPGARRSRPPTAPIHRPGAANTVSAAPSCRFMPIQSQPTASGCIRACSIRGPARRGLAGGNAPALAAQHQLALHGQLGLAVVVAGLHWLGALARQAFAALQQHRLGGVAVQVQAQRVALYPCRVTAALAQCAAGERPACSRSPVSASLASARPGRRAQCAGRGAAWHGPHR
jgi:hypothetical protein